MELVSEKSLKHLKEKIVASIKKDPRFALFYLGPSLKSENGFDVTSWALKVGLEERDARYFEADLRRVGLWNEIDGRVTVDSDFMDLGELKVLEYMTMSMNILSRMSETGPCWYEALYVSTTQEIKKEFLSNINRVLRDFVEKSAAATSSDTIMAWTHGSLDFTKDIALKNAGSSEGKPE